jgi:methionine-rich copper-binding protein CopC
MRLSPTLSAIALSAAVLVAHAHALLKKSTPTDGSTVSSPPASVVLTFSEATRLTAAWIEKGDGPKEKLGPLPVKPATEITVALHKLTAGTYRLSWRALGDDGHVVPGELHFTVSGDATAGQSPSH